METDPAGYRGAVAYARAKRAQVVLSHEWARRWASEGLASYAVHPGWVATPGLATGLPTFAKLGPLLRTPAQGADTIAWLAADEPRRTPGRRKRADFGTTAIGAGSTTCPRPAGPSPRASKTAARSGIGVPSAPDWDDDDRHACRAPVERRPVQERLSVLEGATMARAATQ